MSGLNLSEEFGMVKNMFKQRMKI